MAEPLSSGATQVSVTEVFGGGGSEGSRHVGRARGGGTYHSGGSIAAAVEGAHFEVVGGTVGEAGYGDGKDITDAGPIVVKIAGHAVAVVVAINAEAAVAGGRGPGQRDLTVACGRRRGTVGALVVGCERTVALTWSDHAPMTPLSLTARAW